MLAHDATVDFLVRFSVPVSGNQKPLKINIINFPPNLSHFIDSICDDLFWFGKETTKMRYIFPFTLCLINLTSSLYTLLGKESFEESYIQFEREFVQFERELKRIDGFKRRCCLVWGFSRLFEGMAQETVGRNRKT